ncbi:diguanylate cyclase/phosphodiesterase [Rhodobacter sp. 140A]|nr:diguanylate cyclase/phosphodiesterase [Rhodobacter sp. 140A]
MMVRFWHMGRGGALRRTRIGPVFGRKELLPFLPAMLLAGVWFGIDAMLVIGVTALAVAWLTRPLAPAADSAGGDGVTGLPLRRESELLMDDLLREAERTGRHTACLVIGCDESERLERQLLPDEFETLLQLLADRLRGAVRESDRLGRLGGTRFAVMLHPTQRQDLESLIQLAARLQTGCEEPYSVKGRSLAPSVHVGFCLMRRAPVPTGAGLIAAAEGAAEEARRNGPSAIRAFSSEVQHSQRSHSALAAEVFEALEAAQIVCHFRPQLSTDTGEVSGMEAVPRWLHRERGILTEAEILPAIDSEGLRERLAELMFYQGFGALRSWQRVGLPVSTLSIGISPEVLSNPKMATRLKWELERFDIEPERLRLVLSGGAISRFDDEVIRRNLVHCTALGCQLELAGLGTGEVPVSAIRSTGAQRVRIHASFVRNVDTDPDQQRLVTAIITMAEQIGIETLAEGVSSIGEHAMLSQLGANHVQGDAIAPPMRLEETFDWLERHTEKLAATPRIQGS